ncbi:ArsR/SmtB family transcription factor [Antribacter gilvus]|uniref:ArsR/SmtB family transcription factor n=1 Tax=Antribacter gilvus TaxID=2304675 RepID=UPI000F7B1779|nr:metalloregulator ArsR/SmtB family transcription factor [Antribacter gilvus]
MSSTAARSLDALGDPVRRRVVELLADGPRTAGELADTLRDERGLSQPGTSRHLRVLRESGLVTSSTDAQRRVYALQPGALRDTQDWLASVAAFWTQRLDALDTEIARGHRERHPQEDA